MIKNYTSSVPVERSVSEDECADGGEPPIRRGQTPRMNPSPDLLFSFQRLIFAQMEIANKILKTEPVKWRELEWLQGTLKSISQSSFQSLKNSLIANSFIQPFNVWEDGRLYCLDGHHRKRAMEELEKEGYSIPDVLPANFVKCSDLREAKKLVLVYSSIYAKADEESLYDFIKVNDLDFNNLKLEIDLPEINLGKFEAEYMTDEMIEDEVLEIPEKAKTKMGDLYELGRHRLLCGDSTGISYKPRRYLL